MSKEVDRCLSELDRYLLLVAEKPECFAQSERLRLVLNRDELEAFAKETGSRVGLVYESRFNLMVVDVVEGADGSRFAYERVIPASEGVGVVMIPLYRGRVVLLHQYRHALRRMQYGFPRGYGEDGLSAEDNARKELAEELGARVSAVERIGCVAPDSGLSSGIATVLLCEVEEYKAQECEGIVEAIELSGEELELWISQGAIDDGFTLSAHALYKAWAASRL